MCEPPRRGQPPYKGQMARPRFVLSSEVLLYRVKMLVDAIKLYEAVCVCEIYRLVKIASYMHVR